MAIPLIELQQLTKTYRRSHVRENVAALKHVSLTVAKGQSLGICGESGAGKSSLARVLLGLESFDEGRLLVGGREICNKQQRRHLRRSIQIVWQDPRGYLNPYYTVAEQVLEPLRIFSPGLKNGWQGQAETLLSSVGIPWRLAEKRPHQLSGGQCQRVAIARALAVRPQVLICDEALASLDMPEQVRIIRLLIELQKVDSLTYIIIDHNLNVIRQLCAKMAVMREGSLAEIGNTDDLFQRPSCPYTQQLIENFFQLGKG